MTPQNLLIYGDNLRGLRDLARTHAATFQCVYLDPPYNTGMTFEHYQDARSHDAWLKMMDARLRAIVPLLRDTGFVCVQIDDREFAYLQVLMDSIFARDRRVATVVVKMSELSGVKMNHVHTRLPKLKEYLLIYAASDAARLRPQRVPKDEETLSKYLKYYNKIIENPSDPVSEWRVVSLRDWMRAQKIRVTAHAVRQTQLQEAHRVVYRTNNAFLRTLSFDVPLQEVQSPTGKKYIWWEGKQMLFLADHTHTYLGDLWTDISTINLNKEGGAAFRFSKKPEALLGRILSLLSDPGDWVLDPFAGSGTTGAVAQKLNRRWVMIEQGEHLHTHIVPRIASILNGTDTGGIQPYARGDAFALLPLSKAEALDRTTQPKE